MCGGSLMGVQASVMGRPVFPEGISGTVFPGPLAQDEPQRRSVTEESCSWEASEQGTLLWSSPARVGSPGSQGPTKGCSTQPRGGLWSQPAMTGISCPGLGLPPCLPPVA